MLVVNSGNLNTMGKNGKKNNGKNFLPIINVIIHVRNVGM
jgi:hypothetical protein